MPRGIECCRKKHLQRKGSSLKQGVAAFKISAWSQHKRSMEMAVSERRRQPLGYNDDVPPME